MANISIVDGFKRGRKAGGVIGENVWSRKLKSADIPIIRKMIKDGVKIKDIAANFNVAYGTIYSIKSGQKWKHIL